MPSPEYDYYNFTFELSAADFMKLVVGDETINEDIGRNIYLDDELVHLQTGMIANEDGSNGDSLLLTLHDPIMGDIKYFNISMKEAIDILLPEDHIYYKRKQEYGESNVAIHIVEAFLDVYNDDMKVIANGGYAIIKFMIREKYGIDDFRHSLNPRNITSKF